MGFLSKLQSMLKPKERVDLRERFELKRRAISGTMSKFYMAYDRKYDRIVGLKIADREKVEAFEARFKGLHKPTEGEIATQMDHPLIVKTYEYGTATDGSPYIVMEFLDGPGLQFLLKQRDPVIEGHRHRIVRQMAQALEHVHQKGFIHRDVCPRNFIYHPPTQTVKLIDFGLTVPATEPFMQPGNRTGTPLYMSPEVVRRRDTDARLDIFAFGVSAYQVCTYELPWPSEDATGKTALAHDTRPPVDILKHRPALHPKLARAIMKCIEPDRRNRPQSMDAFLYMIREVESDDAPEA